jgi:arsenite methyltransferase
MKGSHAAQISDESRRTQVRDRYGELASRENCCDTSPAAGGSCSTGGGSSCCTDGSMGAIQFGYTPEQLASLPDGANLGLGCGNPTAILGLRAGQTVLDLGSGAGIDCFLAAKRVGAKGAVIGVDMTPEMLAKARENARKGGYRNVEFRLGEIEHLPVGDGSVDVVISNCVINLAPEKGSVYREAFRALRPGGTFAVSDVVATRPITDQERADPSLWSSCASGALEVRKMKSLLRQAGFIDVRVNLPKHSSASGALAWQATLGVVSAEIQATKPGK